jgi:predicted unusual protein kinase regulating ubiquinone biosynthesis (AarF/ABC1/UbiB family)
LDGVARDLDPQYNLLVAAKPFVKSLATTSIQNKGSGMGQLVKQARGYLGHQLKKPNSTEVAIVRLEQRLEEGELELRVKAFDTDRNLKLVQMAIKSLIYACMTGFTALCGTILLVGGYQGGAVFAFVIATVMMFQLGKSLVRMLLRERVDQLTEG